MKLLFENWRQYLLTEVSYADAKEILNSKGTLKIIKNYEYQMKELYGGEEPLEPIAVTHKQFKDWLLKTIPDDLTDNQKGTAALWLRKLAKEDWRVAKAFIDGATYHGSLFGRLWGDFQTFFHHQRFMPQQDLMNVKTIDDLQRMVGEAKEDIEAHRQTRLKSPEMVKEGTTFLRGGWSQEEELETVPENGWVIMEIHNKAASCFHGTADWCTAAPGLDYFEDYYKPDDPLFIFQQKKYIQDDVDRPPTSYQFHYGTEQFMDKNDHYVDIEVEKELHGLLMQTEAPKKYSIVQNYYYEILAEDRATPPEELAALAENPDVPEGILTKVANNPSTPLETLEQLAKSDNKLIKRAIQVNAALDMGLAIELFVNNPKDELMYTRGIRDMYDFVTDGKLDDEQANQIIDSVVTKRGYNEPLRGYKPQADPTEVANLGRIYEHKIKIRITKTR